MYLFDPDFEGKTFYHLTKLHRAIVVENADPLERGRVKFKMEGIIETGCDPNILLWAYPKLSQQWRPDMGSFTPPPKGATIYIEFADGNIYAPMYLGAAGDGQTAHAGGYGGSIRPYDGGTYDGQQAAGVAAGGHFSTSTVAAINKAAADQGQDPAKLMSLAAIESAGDPGAQNGTAGGLYQFTNGTAAKFGLTNKFDAYASSVAASQLLNSNAASLTSSLGRAPSFGEEYLAHQQGAAGAAKLLLNPDANAASLVGSQAILGNGGNLNMTAKQFSDKWVGKANSTYQKYGGGTGTPADQSAQPSKEPEKYDANKVETEQGPTTKKYDHIQQTKYGINSIPQRQPGSVPEKSWGVAFRQVSDDGTQTGKVNFSNYDGVNNTLDVALQTLGINIHVDNQGRLWVNINKDVMVTIGGKLYTAVTGEQSHLNLADVYHDHRGDHHTTAAKDVTRTVKGSTIDNITTASVTTTNSHEIKANSIKTGPSDSDLSVTPGQGGDPARDKKQQAYDKPKTGVKAEHTKRQVYTKEVSRGHDLVSQAAGSATATIASSAITRAADLALAGANLRVPGGIDAGLPGGAGGITSLLGGSLGGLSSLTGLLSSVTQALPPQITQLLGGIGNPQGAIAGVVNQAIGQALSKLNVMLPPGLASIPLALMHPEQLQQLLATVSNKSALSSVLTSVIRGQLNTLLPADTIIHDDVVKRVVDVLMTPNKLGSLPDAQSPASSLLNIILPQGTAGILSQISNLIGQDQGYFYQQGVVGTTASGTLKYASSVDNLQAIFAHVKELVTTYDDTDLRSILAQIAPTLTSAQLDTVTAQGTAAANITNADSIRAAVNDPTALKAMVTPAIKQVADSPPSDADLTTAATNVANTSNDTQTGNETGEDGQAPNNFGGLLQNAAFVQPLNPKTTAQTAPVSAINNCAPRPQGSVGNPSGPADYQNGRTGDGKPGQPKGDYAGGDYNTPAAGKMTPADWQQMKNYSASDFAHPDNMDRGTAFALDRAATIYGSKIPFTADADTQGHVTNSQHHSGNAIDVNLAGMSVTQRQSVLDAAFQAGFSGFGFYTNSPNMLHIDTRPSGNTWYWGNTNGNVPDWARPVWDAHGGTAAVVGMKPYGGRPAGYTGSDGTPNGGNGEASTGNTDGVGSKPINPPQGQVGGDQAMQAEIVARTIWGEAGGEGYAGMQAIGAVIQNRAKGPAYFGGPNPANVCLKENQFSCWNYGKGGFRQRLCNVTTATPSFRTAVEIAKKVVAGNCPDNTGGADHYHADYVTPDWKWNMTQTATIGHHIFYKSGGGGGMSV